MIKVKELNKKTIIILLSVLLITPEVLFSQSKWYGNKKKSVFIYFIENTDSVLIVPRYDIEIIGAKYKKTEDTISVRFTTEQLGLINIDLNKYAKIIIKNKCTLIIGEEKFKKIRKMKKY